MNKRYETRVIHITFSLALTFLIPILILTSLPSALAISISNGNYTLTVINENGTVKIFKEYDNGKKEEIFYPEGIFENIGKDFPYRKQYERQNLVFNATPSMISWNGEYFLMDNSYSLIEYDGERFTAIRYGEGFYSAYRIKKMIPVDNYWILIYTDAGTPNDIIRIFSGKDKEIITEIRYNRNSEIRIRRDENYLQNDKNVFIDIIPEKKEVSRESVGNRESREKISDSKIVGIVAVSVILFFLFILSLLRDLKKKKRD